MKLFADGTLLCGGSGRGADGPMKFFPGAPNPPLAWRFEGPFPAGVMLRVEAVNSRGRPRAATRFRKRWAGRRGHDRPRERRRARGVPRTGFTEGPPMPASDEHIYKVVELVGLLEASIEDAVQAAITRPATPAQRAFWFEVVETRGHVEDGRVAHTRSG